MQAYLTENHFDVVIMPHLFPAEILTNMKQRGLPIPKTIFVATDYVCIPFTEETECDAYIVPTDELADDFIRRGIPKEKLYPYGIPTHSRFSENEYCGEIKRQLGLDADKKYILITGGSMGGGKIERAIDKIESYCRERNDTELVVVCGSNQELYNRLKERYNQTITVIGYTDEMSSYMKACHLFITKPGGLSSTEAAVCGVPILHTSPIPGCESHNALYFSRHGMSISSDITDSTIALIDDSDRGCQYTSYSFRKLLIEKDVTQSFSKPGIPYDNGVMESFFSSFKPKKYIEHLIVRWKIAKRILRITCSFIMKSVLTAPTITKHQIKRKMPIIKNTLLSNQQGSQVVPVFDFVVRFHVFCKNGVQYISFEKLAILR